MVDRALQGGRPQPVASKKTRRGTIPINALLMEIGLQCTIVEKSFERLAEDIRGRRTHAQEIEAAAQRGVPPLQAEQEQFGRLIFEQTNCMGYILGDIQSILAAAGIVSSIIWPDLRSRPSLSPEQLAWRQTRAEQLQLRLEVTEGSPLNFKPDRSRDVRGGLLHVDEMIEEFAWKRGRTEIETFLSGPIPSALKGDLARAVRWFDEESYVLNVHGRELDLRVLLDEARRIRAHTVLGLTPKLVFGTTKPVAPLTGVSSTPDEPQARFQPRRT